MTLGRSFGSKVVGNANDAATQDKVGVSGAIQANVYDGESVVFNASATKWVMQGGNVTTSLARKQQTLVLLAQLERSLL